MASTADAQSPSSPPTIPWTRKLANFISIFLFRLAFRSDFTVNRCLLRLLDLKVPPSSTPIRGVASSDTAAIASFPDLWARVYNPVTFAEANRLPVIVFFHGGGFAFGSAYSSSIDSFSRDFALQLGAVVVSVNYRLAPEHRFPSQYDDGFDVLKAMDEGLISDALPQNADLRHCFLAGESAGGNIAHHVAARAGEYEFKRVRIAGLIAIQPFFGGEERTESELRYGNGFGLTLEMSDWYWKAYLPAGSNRDHPASNVVGSDISGVKFPAAVVVIGGLDPLSDRIKEYCEWLKKSDKEVEVVEYRNAMHGITWFPDRPEYSMLLQRTREFTKKKIREKGLNLATSSHH